MGYTGFELGYVVRKGKAAQCQGDLRGKPFSADFVGPRLVRELAALARDHPADC
jgi:hypothetical protein